MKRLKRAIEIFDLWAVDRVIFRTSICSTKIMVVKEEGIWEEDLVYVVFGEVVTVWVVVAVETIMMSNNEDRKTSPIQETKG